jgi:hypothetical protein
MSNKCDKCPYKVMAAFVRPTIDELRAYAKEIGFQPFDAEHFYWYHEQTGWVDKGGRPYVNWKGIVQVWFRGAMQRGNVAEAGKSFKDRYLENETT